MGNEAVLLLTERRWVRLMCALHPEATGTSALLSAVGTVPVSSGDQLLSSAMGFAA